MRAPAAAVVVTITYVGERRIPPILIHRTIQLDVELQIAWYLPPPPQTPVAGHKQEGGVVQVMSYDRLAKGLAAGTSRNA